MKRLWRWLLGPGYAEMEARIRADLEAASFEMNGKRCVQYDPERTRRLLGLPSTR